MVKTADLFDFSHSLAGEYLKGFEYPWDALAGIKELIIKLGATLGDDFNEVSESVWIHKSAKVASTASISAPCIIGAETEVRHCAFIRGSALIGEGCVIGNSVEVKNAIIFDGVQVPHFNYVGDSILGYKSHMGAGSVTSNVRSDKALVVIHDRVNGEDIETGRKKVGAMLGDFVEVGCNSVLNPGTVIGRNSIVYPTSCTRGVIPAESIYKNNGTIAAKK